MMQLTLCTYERMTSLLNVHLSCTYISKHKTPVHFIFHFRLCAFVVHKAEDKFLAHVFHCEPSAGPLCKTIEAACKVCSCCFACHKGTRLCEYGYMDIPYLF